jgi:hypothetical protein
MDASQQRRRLHILGNQLARGFPQLTTSTVSADYGTLT